MYLENIFIGSEDIRHQLPQESAMFDGVHKMFVQSMARLQAVGNVLQATTAPSVLAAFQVRACAMFRRWQGGEEGTEQELWVAGTLFSGAVGIATATLPV